MSGDRPTLPTFAELPVRAGAPAHSSWGLWGDEDRLGCWNLVDDAAARRGAAAVRSGRTFRLDAPHDPDLARFQKREPFVHRIERISGIAWDDVIDGFNTQGATQWDGPWGFAWCICSAKRLGTRGNDRLLRSRARAHQVQP